MLFKKSIVYFFLILCTNHAQAQYYLRGEIKDEKNKPVPHAKIFVHGEKKIYYSESNTGSFGIDEKRLYDSLTISLEGFETLTIQVKTDVWQTIKLKSTDDATSKRQPKLISITKDQNRDAFRAFAAGDETYFQLIENDIIDAKNYPSTGFSLNVNKASYSNVRRFLNVGNEVPTDAVRTEELINYFNLGYHTPGGDSLFSVESQLTSCPWNELNKLMFVNVSAKKIDLENVPPGNFVFLIDVSGSMDMPNRLPLLKAAFQLFVKNLRPIDTVSIVTYGGYVQIWLKPTSGQNQKKISEAIESLEAYGDTPGESAIQVAYQLAKKSFIKGGNNRVILATDGDFNVGETSEKALDEMISKQRLTGVYLTCLGVGMGNLKDSKLQTLAKNGNGNYAYLDDIQEAERVLVKELTQTFYAVADDAFMNVNFNYNLVKSYRLIGFDNKKDALVDTKNLLEGGEIGSGSNVLAIFEIEPTENLNKLCSSKSNFNIAEMDLRYSINTAHTNHSVHFLSNPNYLLFDSIGKPFKLATAITMFSLKLKESNYFPYKSWKSIKKMAQPCIDETNRLQKEFLKLIDKAEKIYGNKKRKVD
jgi:Ca-activated chloride channel family protein